MQRSAHHSTSLNRGGGHRFVRGRRHPLDARNKKARGLQLQPPKARPGWPLEELVWDVCILMHVHTCASLMCMACAQVWDVETLRVLLREMLDRGKVLANHTH